MSMSMFQENAITGLTQVKTSSVYTHTYTFKVPLPQIDEARLYALILEVHDKAGNVGYARRLLLLDNSSSVELWPSSSLNVIHANPEWVFSLACFNYALKPTSVHRFHKSPVSQPDYGRDMIRVVGSSRHSVQKKRKIFFQRSQERSEDLSAERCQGNAES